MIILLLLAATFLAGMGYLFESMFFRGGLKAVYMGSELKSQSSVLRSIADEYMGSDSPTLHFIEPGAGIGHVSRFFLKNYSWKSATALELRSTVYIVGKILAFKRFPNLRYVRINLFDYAYRPGSVIYCYLTSVIITKLYSQGAFKGNVVICLTFAIDGIEATKEYPLPGWQQVLRVYDFR